MSPQPSVKRVKRRGNRSKEDYRSSEFDEPEEYMESPITRTSSVISQDDFVDFENTVSPHLDELAELRKDISSSLHAMDVLMDKLTGTFRGRMDFVKGVGESWGKEEEQSKRIEELEGVRRHLIKWNQEEEKKHEDEIAALRRELAVAQSEKENMEQTLMEKYNARERSLDGREKNLSLEHAKKLKAVNDQMVETRKELEKTQRHETRDLKKTIKTLNEEKEQYERELAGLKDSNQKTEQAYEKTELAYATLRRENDSLKKEVVAVRKDFWVSEKPDHYFTQPLKEIEAAVGTISARYFTILPEDAIDGPDHISRILREKSHIFGTTPLTDSAISIALRRANVQHLIMRAICDNIWQPLFCEALWKQKEARTFLGSIVSSISGLGIGRESAWRGMTVEAAGNCSDMATIRQDFLKNVLQEVKERLEPLIEASSSMSLERDMKDLFIKAIELWSAVQKDGSRIIAVCEVQEKTEGWSEALPSLLPDSHSTLPIASKEMNHDPLFLFPKIARISQSKSPKELGESATTRVLYKGSALLNTNIFSLGAEEQETLREQIARLHTQRPRMPLSRKGDSQTANGIETRQRESSASAGAER